MVYSGCHALATRSSSDTLFQTDSQLAIEQIQILRRYLQYFPFPVPSHLPFYPIPSQQAWNLAPNPSNAQYNDTMNLKALILSLITASALAKKESICSDREIPLCCKMGRGSFVTGQCYVPADASSKDAAIASCGTVDMAAACCPPKAVSCDTP